MERVLAHGRARHAERAVSAAERIVGTSGRLMVSEVETLKVELAVRALDEPVDALVGQVGVERTARHLERAGRARHEPVGALDRVREQVQVKRAAVEALDRLAATLERIVVVESTPLHFRVAELAAREAARAHALMLAECAAHHSRHLALVRTLDHRVCTRRQVRLVNNTNER